MEDIQALWLPTRIGSKHLESDCDGVPLYGELARSTYPKAVKPQIHKATKREKLHRTSNPGFRVRLLDQSLREDAVASLH